MCLYIDIEIPQSYIKKLSCNTMFLKLSSYFSHWSALLSFLSFSSLKSRLVFLLKILNMNMFLKTLVLYPDDSSVAALNSQWNVIFPPVIKIIQLQIFFGNRQSAILLHRFSDFGLKREKLQQRTGKKETKQNSSSSPYSLVKNPSKLDKIDPVLAMFESVHTTLLCVRITDFYRLQGMRLFRHNYMCLSWRWKGMLRFW